VAGEFFAREKTCAERCAGVSGDRLDINILEAAAKFDGANKKDVQENAASKAKIVRGRFASEICCESEDEFFEEILCATSDAGAQSGIERGAGFWQACVLVKARRKNAAAIRAGSEIAAVEDGKAFCVE